MPPYKVFISCQQTQAVENILQSLRHEHTSLDIRFSSPPFNRSSGGMEKVGQSLTVRHYNVSCYGVSISRAICRLFDRTAPVYYTVGNTYGALPSGALDWGLNTYVQKHTVRILDEVNSLDKINSAAATTLRDFLKAFISLQESDITSFVEWHRFVVSYGITENWSRNLHSSKVLQNFSFSEEEAVKAREMLKPSTLNWLSKVLAGYNLKGCLADIVNLIYAMTGHSPDDLTTQTENEIVNVIDSFQRDERKDERSEEQKLKEKTYYCIHNPMKLKTDNLWIPDAIIHDCELDDILTLTMCRRLKGDVREYIQLPLSRTSIFYDKDSKNGDNLYEPYLDKLNI